MNKILLRFSGTIQVTFKFWENGREGRLHGYEWVSIPIIHELADVNE